MVWIKSAQFNTDNTVTLEFSQAVTGLNAYSENYISLLSANGKFVNAGLPSLPSQ